MNNDKENSNGMNAIYKAVSYMIQHELENASYDKTFIGLVTEVDLETNTYTVIIDGNEYSDIASMIRANVNDTVTLMCPQNQLSQMFIYGKIDTTDYTTE